MTELQEKGTSQPELAAGQFSAGKDKWKKARDVFEGCIISVDTGVRGFLRSLDIVWGKFEAIMNCLMTKTSETFTKASVAKIDESALASIELNTPEMEAMWQTSVRSVDRVKRMVLVEQLGQLCQVYASHARGNTTPLEKDIVDVGTLTKTISSIQGTLAATDEMRKIPTNQMGQIVTVVFLMTAY